MRPFQPKWNSVCFLFLLPFFLPPALSSAAGVVDPLAPALGAPQALLTGVFRPLLSRRRPRPVYPGLKMVLVGLGAAGRAGNASAIALLLLLANPVDDAVRDGIGDTPVLRAAAGLDDEDIHGV